MVLMMFLSSNIIRLRSRGSLELGWRGGGMGKGGCTVEDNKNLQVELYR
jgi:hypothetical protein